MSMIRTLPLGLVLGLAVSFPVQSLYAAPETPPANSEPARRPDGSPPGGPGAEMTPEQRRARILRPYEEALPDLTTTQKDKIFEIAETANAEIRAARNDTKLSDEEKFAVQQRVRGELPGRIVTVFTESQRKTWDALQDEQRQMLAGTVGHMGELQAGESREEKRARITAGYEEILEELSVKKRSAILEALGTADDAIAATKDKPGLTDKQRQEEITKAEDTALAQITPLLSKEQLERWKKAQVVHDANEAKAAAETKQETENEPAQNAFGVPVK